VFVQAPAPPLTPRRRGMIFLIRGPVPFRKGPGAGHTCPFIQHLIS
jgi:hypothetical protein